MIILNINDDNRKQKIIQLMNDMGNVIRQLGKENSISYQDNLNKFNIVVPLIHIICNNEDIYKYTQLKEKNYSLPFPFFGLFVNDDIWECGQPGIKYGFNTEGITSNQEYIYTIDYNIIRKEHDNFLITIEKEEYQNKSSEYLKDFIVSELEKYVEKFKLSQVFYKGLNHIAYNAPCNDQNIITKFVNLLKDKEELLKIINLCAHENVEKTLFEELIMQGIKIDNDEPIKLLVQVEESIKLLQSKKIKQRVSITILVDTLKNNLSEHIQLLREGIEISDFYKYILNAKLNEELKNCSEQKRLKI